MKISKELQEELSKKLNIQEKILFNSRLVITDTRENLWFIIGIIAGFFCIENLLDGQNYDTIIFGIISIPFLILSLITLLKNNEWFNNKYFEVKIKNEK